MARKKQKRKPQPRSSTVAILYIIKIHPEYTYRKVAEICGVTKQNLNGILRKYHIPHRYHGIGSLKGVITKYEEKGRRRGRPRIWREHYRFCRNCTILISGKTKRFCSKVCHDQYFNFKFFCRTCNKPFIRRKFKIRRKIKLGQYNYYCDQKCFIIGKKYFKKGRSLPLISEVKESDIHNLNA